MEFRPFCVCGVLLLGCQSGQRDEPDTARAAGQASADDPGVVEPEDTDPAPASEPEAEPEPEPEPAPKPTFADGMAPLVAGAEPSADSGKTAWKHLEAKEYGLAQKHFALATLHDKESYKPPFNLACAAALAGDEPIARIALTEAVARDKQVAVEKARTDKDLASMRDKPWFEEVLAGEPGGLEEPGGPDDQLDQAPSMYFVLASGPNGPGGEALLYENGFMGWLDGADRLDLSPDGADYVLHASGTSFISLNIEDADRVVVDPRVDMPDAFDVLSDDEYWAVGRKGLGHYEAGTWTILDTATTVHSDAKARPVAIEHDANGNEWVATTAGLYRARGKSVESVALPGAGEPLALILADASLYLVRTIEVLALEGDAWKPLPKTAVPGETLVGATVHGDGAIVMGLASGGLRRWDAGSVKNLALPNVERIDSLGTDAANRTWVATPHGVFVVKADFSGVLRHYATGSIDELRASEGRERVVQFLAVGGPVVLPPSTKERGVVIGRLTHKGKPLANQAFEMCDDPPRKSSEMGSLGTPCEMSDPSWYAKTDATGRFRLTGVDAGLYELVALLPGGKVGATRDAPCCLDMPDEGTLDLGDVRLK